MQISYYRSWDSLWNGVAQWFGITADEDLNYVLPNRDNFGCRLYTDQDMYDNGSNSIEGCTGETLDFEQDLILCDAQYLQDQEQSRYCDLLIEFLNFDSLVRCVVTTQSFPGTVLETNGTAVRVSVELSSDEEGFGAIAASTLSSNAADIVAAAEEREIVQCMV